MEITNTHAQSVFVCTEFCFLKQFLSVNVFSSLLGSVCMVLALKGWKERDLGNIQFRL